MPFVDTTDCTSLFYTDWGSPAAPPVVFAHAWGLNGDMWGYQISDLVRAGLRCVTYDRRGHGRSDRPGRGYDLDTLADDLAALIEHLDLVDVTLVGHSMGATEVVRYLTRQGAGRVARLVLSAPSTPIVLKTDDNPDGVDEASLEASADMLGRDVGAWLDANGDGYFGVTPHLSPAIFDWTRRTILDIPVPILLATFWARVRSDFRLELPTINVPSLVIHGTADVSESIDRMGRRTAALIDDSRFVAIDGAGHGLYVNDAERYNAELISFCTP